MAISWLVSTCYIKYPQQTCEFLKTVKDDFIFRKSISKVCDSLRVSSLKKDRLRQMKKQRDKLKQA